MRPPLLLAGAVMLLLAAGPVLTPAWAQDAISESSPDSTTEMLNDPAPASRPLIALSVLTAVSAMESPAARQSASAGAGHFLPCSPANPCAVVSPLAPVKPG